METNNAILVMDFINEIIHPDGKFKAKGYASFAQKNNILNNVAGAVNYARNNNFKIVYVKVGFSQDYKEQPKNSILFGKAHQFQVLKLGTWATEFHEKLNIKEEDLVITKHRISPFYSTNLESYLKQNQITNLYLCGVATDLVIQSTARDAHDRDYNVFILSDCCAAGSEEDHKNSLKTLEKIAKVGSYKELLNI